MIRVCVRFAKGFYGISLRVSKSCLVCLLMVSNHVRGAECFETVCLALRFSLFGLDFQICCLGLMVYMISLGFVIAPASFFKISCPG